MSLAIITGAGRRGQLGEAIARRFASDGHRVVLLDRSGDDAGARAAELRADGHDAVAFGVDLADRAALDRVVAEVAEHAAGGVAALVLAAGGFAGGEAVADADPALVDRMVAANLLTAYHSSSAFLPLVRRAGGAVVYLGSPAALPGARGRGMAAYAAAKAGVLSLMRAVAAEEAEHGVRANAIAPAAVRTAANVAAMGADARYVEPATVAAVAAWLASPAAAGVTGQVVELAAGAAGP